MLLVLCGCGWINDSPDTAAYRVEHAKGDPSYVAQIVCRGFETAADPHALFRAAATRQAAVRGVMIHFAPEWPAGRVDAVLESDTSPADFGPGVPVFAVTRSGATSARATAGVVLPPGPRSADYAEAGRRAVDQITDYLRGINSLGAVHLQRRTKAEGRRVNTSTTERRPERTR